MGQDEFSNRLNHRLRRGELYGIECESVDTLAEGKDDHCGRAVEGVPGGNHLLSRSEDIVHGWHSFRFLDTRINESYSDTFL